MNDQTMNGKALPGLAALHMPLQAAPIDRTVSRGALAGTPGVEADIRIENLLDTDGED